MKPLKSIRVLDLTEGNPYIGSMLANYGAEVIKAEPPAGGDSIRRRGAAPGESEGIYQAYYNRGKRSIAVDLTQPEGQEIIRRIAAKVDMVAVNLSHERMLEIGLGYESVKKVNPKIVYGILTPFGDKGPWKDCPDYDLLVMARTGLLEKTGFKEKPTRIGSPLGYYYSSWHLAAGMLGAFLKAQETGESQLVETSTWQCVMSLDDTFAQCLTSLNELPQRIGNGFPTTNPTDTFKCKNGWFSLSIGTDQQWWAFCNAAGKNEWAEDRKFRYDPIRSMENYFGNLDIKLKDFFSTITIEEADRICREAPVPGGPCNTVRELMTDEQVANREMIITVNDPVLGETRQLGNPAKFLRDTEGDNEIAPAPRLGADTVSVLEQAQFSPAEIRTFIDANVVGISVEGNANG